MKSKPTKREVEKAETERRIAAFEARKKALLALVESGLLHEAARLLCIDGVAPNENDFAEAARRAYRRAVAVRDTMILREPATVKP